MALFAEQSGFNENSSLIPVATLAKLAQATQNWSNYRHRDEWSELFGSLSGSTVPCQVQERDYVLGLYRARLDSALARGDDSLDGLDHAVNRLEASTESEFVFAFVSWRSRGYFIWLKRDASGLVAYWRGTDARSGS